LAIIEMTVLVNTEIGIAPDEQHRLQRIRVVVTALISDASVDRVGKSGMIGDTLDYGFIRDCVLSAFKGPRLNLLEQVIYRVREAVRANEHILDANVEVMKSNPWEDVPEVLVRR